MAEAIVSEAAKRIDYLLTHDAVFLSGVRGKFERLKHTLDRMCFFLRDAEALQDEDERIKKFVAEIRELAYDAEDAIDTFLLKAPRRRDGLCGWIRESTSKITKAYQLHEIGAEIDAIRAKLTEISINMQTFGITFISGGEGSSYASETQRQRRRTYSHLAEEHVVVGLEDSKKDVMAQLMTEDDHLRVVSIVGIGGLGKTTLAKRVYNDVIIKEHFDFCCWAFISQKFYARDILLGMMAEVAPKETGEKLGQMSEVKLVETLYNTLKGKRYLLVFDDIWNKEAWDRLKPAIPTKGTYGSRVLFTTRNKEVALYADPRSSPVELPFLSDDDGWTLLREIAIDGKDEQSISPELVKWGKQMVKRCGGLPLAVVVLGGLLASKESLNEWLAVHENISAQIMMKEAYWILALSYRELPFQLKPCFLYLSQFPENYQIHKRDLIRMWIAEGFVSQPLTEDRTLEDVGEEYLNELVSRCMVLVHERDHTGRGVKTFGMNDIMRNMCVLKAEEEGFLQVLDVTKRRESNTNKSRRITVHWSPTVGDEGRLLPVVEGNPCCRSLIYIQVRSDRETETELPKSVFKNNRLLRVLKLDGINLDFGLLGGAIGNNPIHLRYLGLRSYNLDHKLPSLKTTTQLLKFLGNMKSLWTLDLRHKVFNIRIADVLWKLKCLRHLLVGRHDEIGRIDTLTNLETLKDVNAKCLIARDAMQKLRNLRHLGVWFEKGTDVEAVFKSPIFGLGHLRCLKLGLDCVQPSIEFSNLEALSHCYVLTKLELRGKISEDLQQHNLKFLPASLSKLELLGSHFTKDPMPILEKQLPNLRFLQLWTDTYEGSEMVCSAHGFSQLEVLILGFLREIEEWRVEEGAMPRLKTLEICALRKLRKIPEGLKHVASLQQLKIILMPDEFEKRVKVVDGVQGEDFYKVCHIPDITVEGLWRE